MESLLVIVTVVSLVLAAGLAVVSWKLLRTDASRTSDRAEELAALAAIEDVEEPADHPVTIGGDFAPEDHPAAPALVPMRFAALDDDDEEPEIAPVVAAESMFTTTAQPRRGGRLWLGFAALLFVAFGVGSVLALRSSGIVDVVAAAAQPGTPAAAPTVKPLELLSLRHSNDEPGYFSVTGLVEAPAGAPPAPNVVAVVYLFDREGKYFASGTASLDVSTLQPGEQSPFVVKIATTEEVSRYRIGFRSKDGRVVNHVDRRNAGIRDAGAATPGTAEGTPHTAGSGE